MTTLTLHFHWLNLLLAALAAATGSASMFIFKNLWDAETRHGLAANPQMRVNAIYDGLVYVAFTVLVCTGIVFLVGQV